VRHLLFVRTAFEHGAAYTTAAGRVLEAEATSFSSAAARLTSRSTCFGHRSASALCGTERPSSPGEQRARRLLEVRQVPPNAHMSLLVAVRALRASSAPLPCFLASSTSLRKVAELPPGCSPSQSQWRGKTTPRGRRRAAWAGGTGACRALGEQAVGFGASRRRRPPFSPEIEVDLLTGLVLEIRIAASRRVMRCLVFRRTSSGRRSDELRSGECRVRSGPFPWDE